MAFPTAVRRGEVTSPTSNATTWTPTVFFTGSANTLNTAIADGEKVIWVLCIASDGNPTLTENAGAPTWNKVGQASNGAIATGAIFTLETTTAFAAGAHPAFTIDSSGSEQFSACLFAYKVAAGKIVGLLTSVSANGSSTNSDPAAITNDSGASQDVTVVVFRAGDSTVVATAAPTNYGNLITRAAGGTGGASINGADRQVTLANAASENPGTFTSASEQWVTWTVGVYETVAATPIAPDNAASATLTDQPTLAAKSATTPADATSASVTTQPSLTVPATPVAPADANSASSTSEPTLAAKSAVTPAAATSASQTSSPTLTSHAVIQPAAAVSATSTTQPTVAAKSAVTPDAVVSASVTTQPSLGSGAVPIAPADAVSASATTQPSVAAKSAVQPDDVISVSSISSPTLAPKANVQPADAISATLASIASLIAWNPIVMTDEDFKDVYQRWIDDAFPPVFNPRTI